MQTREIGALAALVGGRLHHSDDEVLSVGPAVVIDSRLAEPGALFIAIAGEHVDGHDYLSAARDRGAVAAITTREVADPLPQVIVDDPIAALSALARDVVAQAKPTGLQVLAITGSSGKTSTKDLLAQLLESAAPTIAPVGSFNNEIGVPLTACRIDANSRFLVSEMGARGIGHIAWLCSMTPPDVAAVLNVGSAHLGEFGSVEAIAQAKGEIVEALPATGWAVLNADDPRVAAMASRTRARLAWFSTREPESQPPTSTPSGEEIFVHAAQIGSDDLQRHRFVLVVDRDQQRESHPVALPLLGAHHVSNALAAAAMAIAAGLAPAQVAQVLSRAELRSRWRMELTERADGVAVINDAYNANPDSMTAALTTVASIVTQRRDQQREARAIAVVGDMLELGGDAEQRHREVGRLAATLGYDQLWAVGEFAEQVVAGAAERGLSARAVGRDEASSLDLRPGDVVLVKASRGLALESVAESLIAPPEHLDTLQSGAQS